jgi:hypothetical protein
MRNVLNQKFNNFSPPKKMNFERQVPLSFIITFYDSNLGIYWNNWKILRANRIEQLLHSFLENAYWMDYSSALFNFQKTKSTY